MIDAHIHVVPPRLPGTGLLSPLLGRPLEAVADELGRQMHDAGVRHALAMGSLQGSDDDPLGVAATLRMASGVPGLHAIGVADPTRTDANHLRRVEAALATGQVRALKGYLGYLHFAPEHPNYTPYYELAARYRLPFFFHTGDTYSPLAKLRFAHPLLVDEVAVNHPEVRFILAHFGNPWTLDAAEVVYKNMNVWADLSGLVVGDESAFTDEERQDLLNDLRATVQRGFRYAERPNRFLYGSDWPLIPMTAYRDFVGTLIPPVYHELVFQDNARVLFGLS
jgi:predicted TIM-barrel fold metal-dependent hydrolase